MARSKHFRKDVIIARVIFAGICVAIIAVIALVLSLLMKPSEENKDTQKLETSENTQQVIQSEEDVTIETESESEAESESETEDVVYYVVPVTEVRFRTEPDTDSTTIEKLPAGTKTILVEELEGWYYVEYNGEYGYISADYSEIEEGN